jgi:type IV pilus assembly protein PilY1
MSTFLSLFSSARPGAAAVVALLALVANAWAVTEPAQVPLTSRVAEPPTPNVMLTIDDSGSMLADFMPEGTFTINGGSVNLANAWVGAFPADWRKLCTSGVPGCVTGTWPTGNYLAGVATSVKSGNAYQMQFRSPDVNKIFYNPDLVYLPWYESDGSGNRMPNSVLSAARYDPVVSSGTFNLSKNYTGGSAITTVWYTGPGSKKSEGKDFYPGQVYRLNAGKSPTSTANFTRYDILATDGSHAPATKHPNRTDCKAAKCTLAEEQQNFANWFTYYRMRESLTKAAVSESFVLFKDKLRVGWGRINKSNKETLDGASFKIVENETNGGPLRPLDGTRLAKVLTGVQKIASWPSTPLRIALDEVGRYFFVDDGVHTNVRPAAGSPWLTDPSNVNSEKLTCRRSVSLLMTDGYYNDSYSAAGNVDGSNGPSYTGNANPGGYSPTEYVAQRPYIDAPNQLSNTLADVASRYYVMDMDTSIANKVPPVSGDIAYWQHLTQFMVGLGVYGTLDSSTPEKKSETLKQLTVGTKNWPDPASGSPQKIDDMWHAAVNTGGDFYSVSNVTELTEALKDAFGRAAGNEAKEAGVATASATLVADNVKYVPKYKSVSWFGDLEAWALDADGNTPDFPTWRASEKLPAHGSRNLFTSVGSDAIEFMSTKSAVVDAGGLGKDLVDYIRGDTSKEGDGQAFRSRRVGVLNQLLGDFVDSPPVVVKGLVDLGYTAFDASYADYVAQKKARTDSGIVLGGNAGMVHVFRGTDGQEVFGYLPQEGLSKLSTIAAKDYGTTSNFHRFFVNGPMNETDVKIDDAWANLVLGAMGSGGKTFFALRFPTDFGATLDAADLGKDAVLWEKSGKDDGDIGYMFADFAVGKIKGGGWKAFIGNGVYSDSGNSVLLVVDIATGSIDKITVDNSGNTGMMGVSLIKDTTTREVVGAYAGDLKGNVWRFDFEGGSSSEWKVGFSGEPLFVAVNVNGDRLPITVPPVFVLHPTKGRVVLVGTGRLIDKADSDSIDKQTFFGVWDDVAVGEFSSQAVSPFYGQANGRDKLQVQTVNVTPINDTTGTFYTVDTTPVNWTSQLGWYMDLPFDGQRVLYPSLVLGLDYVFFSTVVPARDVAQCESSSGKGYNYLLVAADGTQPAKPIFDTNGDGVVDESDQVASGYGTVGDGRDAIVSDKDNPLLGGDLKDGSNGTGNGSGGEGEICNTEGCKKVDLDCITNCTPPNVNKSVVDRVWKQIMNPPKPE